MTLNVRGVVDRGLDIQEALGRAWRLETLLLALAPSDRLMRILRTIVGTLIIDVLSGQAEGPKGDMTGSEFIGCDPDWRPPVLLQKFPHQLQCSLGVPLRLHEEIQNLAFIVNGSPQLMAPPSNDDDHFV
jgi:hypothetical protein